MDAASRSSSVPSGTAPDGVCRFKAHDTYRHEAFLWKGEGEFLAVTVPFVQDGLRAGQPVMVAVIEPRIALLREALGPDAHDVHFVDMEQLGRNPARIIPAWRQFIDDQAVSGQALRGIGEPIWAGRREAEVAECQLHEALLNVAVDPVTPLWLLCPYDLDALPDDVVVEAQRSHPVMVGMGTYRGSTLYGGAHHVSSVFESDLPAADARPLGRWSFDREDLALVRQVVAERGQAAGLTPALSADLALAVHEVAMNSVKHGRGVGVLTIWSDPASLVCEVQDDGRLTDPLTGRIRPTEDVEGGRGLWLANHLCDLVQVRSGPSGTTVRIHTWL